MATKTILQLDQINTYGNAGDAFLEIHRDGQISSEKISVSDLGVGQPGPQGSPGSDGAPGKTAYEIALENGFIGTQQEWLTSLVGHNGSDGAPGKSAYVTAIENGFIGTETEWLSSLKGEQGPAGQNGTNGKDGVNGADGKSAYQIAVDNGFEGDINAWLLSLKGEKGEDGNTADVYTKTEIDDLFESTGIISESGLPLIDTGVTFTFTLNKQNYGDLIFNKADLLLSDNTTMEVHGAVVNNKVVFLPEDDYAVISAANPVSATVSYFGKNN